MSYEGDVIDAARDAAQQIVTACLHGDRNEAVVGSPGTELEFAL